VAAAASTFAVDVAVGVSVGGSGVDVAAAVAVASGGIAVGVLVGVGVAVGSSLQPVNGKPTASKTTNATGTTSFANNGLESNDRFNVTSQHI
jgi:hypothetical protein